MNEFILRIHLHTVIHSFEDVCWLFHYLIIILDDFHGKDFCVYVSLSSLCRHAISFNSIKNNVKILLEIHTENTDDTSKDRPEDAYLIYPKDNHIKILARLQTTHYIP